MSNQQGKNGRKQGDAGTKPESPLQSLAVPTQLYKRVTHIATKHGLPRSAIVTLALESFFASGAQAEAMISRVSIKSEIDGARRHLQNLLNRAGELNAGKISPKKNRAGGQQKMKRVADPIAIPVEDGVEMVEA